MEHLATERQRFAPAALHRAATMYYLQDATQAQIASELQVSRSTVSRLLTEARRVGVVEITVHPVVEELDSPEQRLAEVLELRRVRLAGVRGESGWALRQPVSEALLDTQLKPGDTMLVASGRMLHALSRQPLPRLGGVIICPTVGGVSEPEAWHQTNEIVRQVAERVHGQPQFLWAPAMPSSAMRATLDQDPQFRSVTAHWETAKVALVGVGAPPLTRDSISTSVPLGSRAIRRAAGDVCLNFYDERGRPVEFTGSDRMVRISPDQLRAVPTVIAAATGVDKAGSVIAGARAGYFDELITDRETADAVLALVGD